MWETHMCSAATLVILDSWKIKSSSPLLIWLESGEHQVFMEILAKEKPEKRRVTVFFDDKKQPLPDLIFHLLLR